jgi:Glycosyl transferase family 2
MLRSSAHRNPVIAVPVRNEAERLPTLLKALAKQSWIAIARRPLRVVLVLNNCTDQSSAVAAAFADATSDLWIDIIEIHFPARDAHVGSARRLAMDRAVAVGGANALLLTTDADASPCRTWVEANLRAVGAGADLVGGHIVGDPEEELLLGPAFNRRASRQMLYNRLVDHLAALIDPVAHDPWPRHSDHTDASLAVKADVYEALGGIPPFPCREDVAFVQNARRAGFRLRHALDVRVQVSARLDGRAKGGMADCIQGWLRAEQQGLPHFVEDPAYVLHRLEQKPRAVGTPFPNANRTLSVKGPDIDVDTAIARLERLIARNGIRYVA